MFAEYITTEQEKLKADDREMSLILKVSVPTIGRWKRGVSTPHPLAEASIKDVLKRQETINESIQKILDGDYEILEDDDLD